MTDKDAKLLEAIDTHRASFERGYVRGRRMSLAMSMQREIGDLIGLATPEDAELVAAAKALAVQLQKVIEEP